MELTERITEDAAQTIVGGDGVFAAVYTLGVYAAFAGCPVLLAVAGIGYLAYDAWD